MGNYGWRPRRQALFDRRMGTDRIPLRFLFRRPDDDPPDGGVSDGSASGVPKASIATQVILLRLFLRVRRVGDPKASVWHSRIASNDGCGEYGRFNLAGGSALPQFVVNP